MTRLAVAASLGALVAALVAPGARAEAGSAAVDERIARSRALYNKGDFLHARDELLAAYQLEARPELLFALGQVELNLGHFAKAIAYYEQFLASSPAADQAALAQQAIGAARARLSERPPPPPPPRPRPHREWDTADSGLAASGAATLVTGVALLTYSHELAGDRGGTLSAYDQRLSKATLTQWIGAGCAIAGALAIGGAVLRWRLHLVDGELQPLAAQHAAGLTWGRPW
ncbi:MAG TPA: tetratricopeptide repeat protein [Kofleriaceae bacterium]|nr:tetratricopeptide repeat protein [Kofleriaceae bacterium]